MVARKARQPSLLLGLLPFLLCFAYAFASSLLSSSISNLNTLYLTLHPHRKWSSLSTHCHLAQVAVVAWQADWYTCACNSTDKTRTTLHWHRPLQTLMTHPDPPIIFLTLLRSPRAFKMYENHWSHKYHSLTLYRPQIKHFQIGVDPDIILSMSA